jgi:tetratricopeptide (TPR) repeat protein
MSGAGAGILLVAAFRVYSLAAGWTAAAVSAGVAAAVLASTVGSLAVPWTRRGALGTGPVATLALALAAFGGFALLVPLPFRLARAAYVHLWPLLGGTPAGVWGLRFGLALVIFAVPAAIFWTAPALLARAIVSRPEGAGMGLGFSYGLTFAGLGLGTLAASQVSLSVGVRGCVLLGAALAGLGASGMLLLRQRGLEGEGSIGATLAGSGATATIGGDVPSAEASAGGAGAGALGAASALFGFTAWGYFVAWERTLTFTLGGTLQSRTLIGATFLIGVSLGAILAAGLADRLRRPVAALAGLFVASSLVAYGAMYQVPAISLLYLRLTPLLERPGLALGPPLAAAALLMLPSCALLGAGVPFLARLAASRGGAAARAPVLIGIGIVAAELTVPLLVIPQFGLRRAVALEAAVGVFAAVVLLGLVPFRAPATRATATLALLGLMVALGGFPASWDPRLVVAGLYRYGARSLARFGSARDYQAARRGVAVDFYREGSDASVMVESSTGPMGAQAQGSGILALTIDGKVEAVTGPDLRTQILQGHIPLLLRGPAEDVLLVDFLNGVTAASILRHPIRSLTVVEREPAVLEAARAFGGQGDMPHDDARLRVVADTARSRLLGDPAVYDVVIVAGMEPWLPHSAALLTAEAYDLVKRRLRPGGILAQRVQLTATTEAALRAILRTFARSFDTVMLFQISPEDLLVLGSAEPIRLDVGWVRNVIGSNSGVAEDLRRAVVFGPTQIIQSFRLDGTGLRRLLADGAINEDDPGQVESASVRNLRVHQNGALLASIDGAWSPILPLLANYGAAPREQAGFLYELAKSYLGFAEDAARARDLAGDLAGMGEAARARWVMGECLLQQGDIDGALGEWRAVLDLDPHNLDALFSLGMYYLDTRDHWKAENFLARAARRFADTPVVRYHHGRNLFHLERHREAIAELQATRRLAGERESYPLIPYLVGVASHRLKRETEARESLEAYLKWAYTQPLTRVEVDAHQKLAEVYDGMGMRFQAHRERQKADDLLRRFGAAGIQPAPGGETPAPGAVSPPTEPAPSTPPSR